MLARMSFHFIAMQCCAILYGLWFEPDVACMSTVIVYKFQLIIFSLAAFIALEAMHLLLFWACMHGILS